MGKKINNLLLIFHNVSHQLMWACCYLNLACLEFGTLKLTQIQFVNFVPKKFLINDF